MTVKKYYIVYRTTNTLNGRIYIGFHSTNNLDDGYLGSGKLIKAAIKKYGRGNFTREILFIFDNRDDAEAKERELVNYAFIAEDTNYNLSIGGNVLILPGENNPWFGKNHTQETIDCIQAKIKATQRERGYGRRTAYAGMIGNAVVFNRNGFYSHGYKTTKSILMVCGNPRTKAYFFNADMQIRALDFYESEVTRSANAKRLASIKKSQKMRGVPKSAEFKRRMQNIMKGRKCPWNQITNRNPDKIQKTANAHRGTKRSIEACHNIRQGIKRSYERRALIKQ